MILAIKIQAMTKKTPSYQLRASANYERKMLKKTLRFNLVDDADLLEVIDSDKRSLNSLAHSLLREHYKLSKK